MSVFDDISNAHRANLAMRALADRAAAINEAAGWRARYEHTKADYDSLLADHARLSAETVAQRERAERAEARVSVLNLELEGIKQQRDRSNDQ